MMSSRYGLLLLTLMSIVALPLSSIPEDVSSPQSSQKSEDFLSISPRELYHRYRQDITTARLRESNKYPYAPEYMTHRFSGILQSTVDAWRDEIIMRLPKVGRDAYDEMGMIPFELIRSGAWTPTLRAQGRFWRLARALRRHGENKGTLTEVKKKYRLCAHPKRSISERRYAAMLFGISGALKDSSYLMDFFLALREDFSVLDDHDDAFAITFFLSKMIDIHAETDGAMECLRDIVYRTNGPFEGPTSNVLQGLMIGGFRRFMTSSDSGDTSDIGKSRHFALWYEYMGNEMMDYSHVQYATEFFHRADYYGNPRARTALGDIALTQKNFPLAAQYFSEGFWQNGDMDALIPLRDLSDRLVPRMRKYRGLYRSIVRDQEKKDPEKVSGKVVSILASNIG